MSAENPMNPFPPGSSQVSFTFKPYHKPALLGLALLLFSHLAVLNVAPAGPVGAWWFLASLGSGVAGAIYCVIGAYMWLWPAGGKDR